MKKLIVLAALVICATSANATTFVTSRGAIGANDYIDWSQLGVAFQNIGSPVSVTSNLSSSSIVANLPGNLQRRDQGNGWIGNFAFGDALLWTALTKGPIVIDFLNPVVGAGAQIQSNKFGPFTARLDVYGSNDSTLLSSYTLPGYSSSFGDNSAIFLGVTDDLADIGKIVYSVSNGDFAINRLSLDDSGTPVPEPSTIALLGLGLAGLCFARRKTQKHP